ncbi:hypothetical protein M8C21_020707, partial [Ambrosia artemisiifolia]
PPLQAFCLSFSLNLPHPSPTHRHTTMRSPSLPLHHCAIIDVKLLPHNVATADNMLHRFSKFLCEPTTVVESYLDVSCDGEVSGDEYMEEIGHASLNNGWASHNIERLGNLVWCTVSAQVAAFRLLFGCSLTWMYPHVFEETILDNLKGWVMDGTLRSINEEHKWKNGTVSIMSQDKRKSPGLAKRFRITKEINLHIGQLDTFLEIVQMPLSTTIVDFLGREKGQPIKWVETFQSSHKYVLYGLPIQDQIYMKRVARLGITVNGMCGRLHGLLTYCCVVRRHSLYSSRLLWILCDQVDDNMILLTNVNINVAQIHDHQVAPAATRGGRHLVYSNDHKTVQFTPVY